MPDISQFQTLNGTLYNFKDSQHRADKNNPHEVTNVQTNSLDNSSVAHVELTTTASKNYSIDDKLVLNSILYKAIQPIAQNDTFIVDTNIQRVTVEELIDQKQNILIFDNVPTSGSDNPVKSSGIYNALSGKADNSIIAIVETSTASKDYAVGDYLILSGILYQATAAITEGSTITAGVNVQAAVLSDEFSPVEKTASGAIASFVAMNTQPLRSLRIGINPVQDLHGYDAPWPAGGGANLVVAADIQTGKGISGTNIVDSSISDITGLIPITPGAMFTIIPGQTSSTNQGIIYYNSSKTALTSFNYSGDYVELTAPSGAYYVQFAFPTGANPKCNIGPYSNICPISGWTGAKVWRTGKNLVKTKDSGRTNNQVTFTVNTDGSIKAYGTATGGTAFFRSGGTPTEYGTYIKAGTYKLTGGISNTKILYLVGVYVDGTGISNSTVTGGVYDRGSGLTFTLLNDAYIAYQIQIVNGTEVDDTFYPMICKDTSAVASDFTPYVGTTIHVTFTEAGTVYGGELDVINEVLTVDRAMVDLGTLDWTVVTIAGTRPGYYVSLTQAKTVVGSVPFNGIAEKYKTIRFNAITTGDYLIALRDSGLLYVTGNESPTGQLVYELATPIEYDLTPEQLTTLAGQNVVWADTGDVAVTYRAGTNALLSDVMDVQAKIPSTIYDGANGKLKEIIDGVSRDVMTVDVSPTSESNNPVKSDGVYQALTTKANNSITAPVENGDTSTNNYSVGNLLIHNNILYKVTTAIAIGDTITSGTNVSETTIDEIIEGLLPPKPTTDGSYYLSYIKNTNSTNYTWIPRSSWEQYRDIVRSGQASTLYPVGNQLTDTWYQSASTSYNVPWDIVHYSTDKKTYLQWHYTIPDTVAFDQPEALYYFDGTEQPGQYYIQIKYAYGTGWVVDACISFTLTSQPDKDDQLVIATATSNATDPTNGIAWNVYAKGGSTSKQSGTTSNSSTGTKLGETSSLGTGYTNGKVNSPQRVVYGYNRWSQSAYRQYLNSSYPAGYWWSAQNPWDRPPAVATTLQGFMRGFTDDFLDVVKKSQVVTALNTVEGLSETSEITEDYFFLPSLQQLYVSPQLADVEGEDWDYYKNLAASAGLTGRFSTGVAYPELIKYAINNTSSAQLWRLRSASRGSASNAWHVNASGAVSNYSANYASRCAPACIIS